MLNRVLVAAVAVLLTALACVLVIGDGSGQGRVLVALTGSSGVHTGDLPIVVAWLAGLGCCAALMFRQP